MSRLLLITMAFVAVLATAVLATDMELESRTLADVMNMYDVLPISEKLTPLERNIVANYMPKEQARVLLQLDSQHEAEQENENENESESEVDTEADADTEADVDAEADSDSDSESDDTSALEVSGTEEITSSTVNFLEMDAEVEHPLYAAARDSSVDPLVRTFLKRSALRSESEELAQLEAGQLEFDAEGNDVLLEHSPAGSFDDNIEGALRARIEEKWKAEGYYQNPQAEFAPREDDAGSFLEMTAVQHVENEADADADADSDAESENESELDSESDSDAESDSDSESDAETAEAESASFLEFDPSAIKAHKEGHIGKMRHIRTRAKRIQNRRLTPPAASDKRNGVALDSFGPYDERRDSEEARNFSPDMQKALDAERKQRLGTVRAVGLSRAPFCATFPFCKQTPPPPALSGLPPNENAEAVRAEMARLDPLLNLPVKLEELKKDPHRFGVVFQSIYDRNDHNEKLKNKMAAN